MKLTTFPISRNKRIFTRLLDVFESLIKTKARSHWTLFIILLTSGVNSKQKHVYGNKITQYIQDCKCLMLVKAI